MPDYVSKITIDGDEILIRGVPSPVVSRGTDGLCPALPSGSGTSKYLREDGTWVVPPDTTYNEVSKTANGLCPQLPNESTTTKYLRQDGTWAVPPDTYNGTDATITWSSAWSYDNTLRKLGNICLIWARYQYGESTSTTGIKIGTLPSGYRPSKNIRIPCIKTNASDVPTGNGVIYINTTGEMWYFGDSMAFQEYIVFDGFIPV